MKKFFGSFSSCLFSRCDIADGVLPRNPWYTRYGQKPFDLTKADRTVVVVGEPLSERTVGLCNAIVESFPWWRHLLSPPRGLVLNGSIQRHGTMDDWLKNQIGKTEREDSWAGVEDMLCRNFVAQSCRRTLHKLFKEKLPAFLRPQPVIIVVDHTEELLRTYRTDVLVCFRRWIQKARDRGNLRLVLVVSTENAVKALKLMDEGGIFTFVQAPKVSREAVAARYGEVFAKIFDECESCIGVALDYVSEPRDVTAREHADPEGSGVWRTNV